MLPVTRHSDLSDMTDILKYTNSFTCHETEAKFVIRTLPMFADTETKTEQFIFH